MIGYLSKLLNNMRNNQFQMRALEVKDNRAIAMRLYQINELKIQAFADDKRLKYNNVSVDGKRLKYSKDFLEEKKSKRVDDTDDPLYWTNKCK